MGRKRFAGIGSVVACFEEPNTSGDVLDINAGRNAPMLNPVNYLSTVYWHSSFDQFELASGPTNVTINHTALGVSSTTLQIGSLTYLFYGAVRETDILLYTHSLGYKPRVKVTISGRAVVAGQIVQQAAGQYRRAVSVFVTTSGVYLREIAVSSDYALPAWNQTYRVFIFAQAAAVPGAALFKKQGTALTVGRGAIKPGKKYLRRTGAGDEEFSINQGVTVDINNGFKRVVSGGVVITESGYGGSLSAPPFVNVGL